MHRLLGGLPPKNMRSKYEIHDSTCGLKSSDYLLWEGIHSATSVLGRC